MHFLKKKALFCLPARFLWIETLIEKFNILNLETTKLIFESSCSKPQGKYPSLHPHMKNLKDLPIMAKDTHKTKIALKYEG